MNEREYAVYSSYHQGWWSEDNRWEPWPYNAKGFPTIQAATDYISLMGWRSSTHADIRDSAYVCELVS